MGFEVLVVATGGVEFVFRVVVLNEVLDNGTGFPECDVGVGVNDGGDAGFEN